MAKAQVTQLKAVLVEGQGELTKYKQVVDQLESAPRIFRPTIIPPQGVA